LKIWPAPMHPTRNGLSFIIGFPFITRLELAY